MEFTVTFFSKGSGRALEAQSKEVGLELIDWVRGTLKVPLLEIGRIHHEIKGYKQDPRMEITENIARRSGHFGDKNHITVYTKPGALNEYLENALVFESDAETGEIKHVVIEQRICPDCLIGSWADDGFPLEWNLSE